MAVGNYIGRAPVYGAFQRQVFTGTTNGSTTSFTLNIPVPGPEAIMVVISGVVQEPNVAYNTSNTTLTLTGAPATGEQFYVVYLGQQLLQTGTTLTRLIDADADTQIQVEESAEDDTIRFDAAGAEAARISATGLDIAGSNKELRFYEAANYVGFEAPALSANQIWVLPAADGTNGQMLSTNGSGTLAWATASSTVTGLTDTTISSIGSGEILKWNGSAWINNTLAEAGIETATIKDADNNTKVQVEESADENKIRFDTAGTERMIIDAGGSVGIGTSSPTRQLELKGSSDNVPLVIDTAAGAHAGIWLKENGTDRWQVYSEASSGDLAFFNYSTSDESMRIEANGELNMKYDIVFGTAGKGICLGVTSNTDANTLDDYEEGTWTAGFAGGSGSVTINTSYDLLSYTKIGNIVHISGRIRISSVSSPSGEIYISGLPFAPTTATGEDTQHQYIGIHFRSAASDVGAVSGQTGTSSIQLYEAGTTGNTAVGDKIGGGTIIMIGGSYRTDS